MEIGLPIVLCSLLALTFSIYVYDAVPEVWPIHAAPCLVARMNLM